MIELKNLTKVFDTPSGQITAADCINMVIPEGKICILLGPSGCGKTTALKMVNRIVTPTSGEIYINGKNTDDYNLVELRRNIGYVIQQIGLFPNMTVAENIGVIPKLMGWNKKQITDRVKELLTMVALDPNAFYSRFPNQLSGGQQQRVGVARALAVDPPVMLMDEPFGAIDPINREVIQDEFLKMQQTLKKTIMFVSHDIDEAVKMGDKIAIFKDGILEQYDDPDDILAHPKNDFIHQFVGVDRTLKRLTLLSVSDAMFKNPPSVKAEDNLSHAKQLMEEYGHANIVLIGPKGRARGVVTRQIAESNTGLCDEHYEGLNETIQVTADLRVAVSAMFTQDLTWLACVDNDGFYKGYVTQRAITHLLGETYKDHTE
ncbi:MAG: ABC transporter ATP-binding protein [Ostreibacterium sp.]